MKPKQLLLAAAAALALALLPGHLPACGPFFPEAVFAFPGHPPLPPNRYIKGDLGVVPSSYARRYLVVAWRYLSAKPLTAREQAGALPPQFAPSPGAVPGVRIGSQYYPGDVQDWLSARARVYPNQPQPKIELDRLVPGSDWERFSNCTPGAFATAARTLADRLKTVPDRSQVARWVAAQDAVFSNCGADGRMPAPPESGLPPVLAADRAYQTAAAHFYRTEFDLAHKEFLAIGSDASSPWSRIAPYLAARCRIRQWSLGKSPDPKLLAQAEQELQSVLNDPGRREFHSASQGLLSYVSLRLHPEQRLAELSRALADPANEADFEQNLIDYEYLMDRRMPVLSTDLNAAAQEPEITAWIVDYSVLSKPSTDSSVEMWRKTRSLPWLVAAISKLLPADPATAEIVAAAEKIPATSPAYPTLAYERTRLLLDAGDRDGARRLLDAELPGFRKTLASDSLNLFLARRMALARNLEEFLQFAPRLVAGWTYNEFPEWEASRPLFDTDSARVLNEQLPLESLAEAATAPTLPDPLRNELATAAWTRAVLLENQPAASALGPAVARLHPEIAPFLKEYQDASGAGARRFAAAWLFLHNPGLKPYVPPNVDYRVNYASGMDRLRTVNTTDMFRNNWWPSFVPDELGKTSLFRLWQQPQQGQSPEPQPAWFLTNAQKARFLDEWARLEKLDAAPNYLGRVAIAWAREHPSDPRVPEALHLAVRATRLGMTTQDTGRVSKEAFDLLHAKYPGSSWAKATKYWYK